MFDPPPHLQILYFRNNQKRDSLSRTLEPPSKYWRDRCGHYMSFIPQKGNFITLDPQSKAAVASDVMGYVYQIKDVKTDFVTVSVVGKVATGSESDHKLLVVHSSTKSNLPKFFYFKDYHMKPYKGHLSVLRLHTYLTICCDASAASFFNSPCCGAS